MKKIIFATISILLHTHGYSQLVNYTDKGKVKLLATKTELSITGVDTRLKSDQHAAGLIAAAGTILPPVIDLVVNSVKEKAKKNALAYKGEYAGSVSHDKFYVNNDYAALPKLTLKRVIKTTTEGEELAVEIELGPEISADKTAFRFYVKDKCVYRYSIAKTKSNYDYIDVSMEIKFKGLSIQKNVYKLSDLRTTTILIPMIHVGQTTQLPEKVYSGWIPLPPRSTLKSKTIVPVTEEKETIKTNTAGVQETTREETRVKKSTAEVYEMIADNTGMYEIEINVIETNPYKIKSENTQTIVESSSESTTAILNALLEVLTAEKEEEE